MTRFCIITDEVRHVKMAIVDCNVTPLLSVNDPSLMAGMPKGLTAATGMDTLTLAIEANADHRCLCTQDRGIDLGQPAHCRCPG